MSIAWKRLPRGQAAGAPFDGSDVLLAVPSIVLDQRGRDVGVDPDHPYSRYIAYWDAERSAWATSETDEDTQEPLWLALEQPRFWAELDHPREEFYLAG